MSKVTPRTVWPSRPVNRTIGTRELNQSAELLVAQLRRDAGAAGLFFEKVTVAVLPLNRQRTTELSEQAYRKKRDYAVGRARDWARRQADPNAIVCASLPCNRTDAGDEIES